MRRGLAKAIIEVIYSRGCVSMQELRMIFSDEDYKLLKNMVSYLKRKGVIEVPYRGLYCRPGYIQKTQR